MKHIVSFILHNLNGPKNLIFAYFKYKKWTDFI